MKTVISRRERDHRTPDAQGRRPHRATGSTTARLPFTPGSSSWFRPVCRTPSSHSRTSPFCVSWLLVGATLLASPAASAAVDDAPTAAGDVQWVGPVGRNRR
jgi:hypothetical protein